MTSENHFDEIPSYEDGINKDETGFVEGENEANAESPKISNELFFDELIGEQSVFKDELENIEIDEYEGEVLFEEPTSYELSNIEATEENVPAVPINEEIDLPELDDDLINYGEVNSDLFLEEQQTELSDNDDENEVEQIIDESSEILFDEPTLQTTSDLEPTEIPNEFSELLWDVTPTNTISDTSTNEEDVFRETVIPYEEQIEDLYSSQEDIPDFLMDEKEYTSPSIDQLWLSHTEGNLDRQDQELSIDDVFEKAPTGEGLEDDAGNDNNISHHEDIEDSGGNGVTGTTESINTYENRDQESGYIVYHDKTGNFSVKGDLSQETVDEAVTEHLREQGFDSLAKTHEEKSRNQEINDYELESVIVDPLRTEDTLLDPETQTVQRANEVDSSEDSVLLREVDLDRQSLDIIPTEGTPQGEQPNPGFEGELLHSEEDSSTVENSSQRFQDYVSSDIDKGTQSDFINSESISTPITIDEVIIHPTDTSEQQYTTDDNGILEGQWNDKISTAIDFCPQKGFESPYFSSDIDEEMRSVINETMNDFPPSHLAGVRDCEIRIDQSRNTPFMDATLQEDGSLKFVIVVPPNIDPEDARRDICQYVGYHVEKLVRNGRLGNYSDWLAISGRIPPDEPIIGMPDLMGHSSFAKIYEAYHTNKLALKKNWTDEAPYEYMDKLHNDVESIGWE